MTKSSGSTTTKQTTEPWSEAQPYQKSLMGEAAYGYQNGMLSPSYYPGATFVGASPQELAGLSQQETLANQGNPLATSSMNQANAMISGGGMTNQQQDILNPLTNIAMGTNGQTVNTGNTYGDIYSGLQGPTAAQTYGAPVASGQQGISNGSMYSDVYSGAGAPTAAQTYATSIAAGSPTASSSNLTGMAAGEDIGANNANTMASLDYAAQQAGDAVNSTMNGYGRYGSDVAQGTLAREVGNIYSTGLMNQQNIDTQNQLAANTQVDAANQQQMATQLGAAGLIDSSQNANAATQLGAASGLTGVQGQNISNQLGAAGLIDSSQNANVASQLGAVGGQTGVQAANIANQAGASQALNSAYDTGANTALNYANAAPSIYESQYAPSQHLIDTGAAYRAEEQAQLQDQINRYYGNASQFSNNLNSYNNLINGVTSGYNTTTASVPQGSPIAGMLGGAAQATGLTANMGYTDPYTQALAAMGGAAVGMM